MFALLFMTTFLRTSIDTSNSGAAPSNSGVSPTNLRRQPGLHPPKVKRRTGQLEDTDDALTSKLKPDDNPGILPGMHNPPLEKFHQDAGRSVPDEFFFNKAFAVSSGVRSNNDPQLEDVVTDINKDLYDRNTDWRSVLQKHEAMKPPDARNMGPRSPFVKKLYTLEEDLMLKANGTVASNLHTITMPDDWRNHLARTPPDQPIEFLTPILPLPAKILQNNNTRVVVLVLSHQGSFIKRQAIRETWAKNQLNVLFVVAQSGCAEFKHDLAGNDVTFVDRVQPGNDNNLQGIKAPISNDNRNEKHNISRCNEIDHNFLRLEQEKNQDLLEIPMIEKYTRLPEKLLQAYHWVLSNVPDVEWIVKSDDDMFVRVDHLDGYLKKYNCNIPMWAELDYHHLFYPFWPKGSAGHVVSRTAATYFSKMSENLHRYQGEDTSIGIWLDNAQKNKTMEDVTYIHSKSMFASHGKNACMSPKTMIIGHDLRPDELLTCFQNFSFAFSEKAWLDDASGFEEMIRQETGDT
ncbi:MAG: hypothetical protein SGILL_000631, partial [Bacillariaceae sp.]